MTIQLEETIERLDRRDALQVLEAVNGTLEALRQDANEIGATPEMVRMISRIETYMDHLQRQKKQLDGFPEAS